MSECAVSESSRRSVDSHRSDRVIGDRGRSRWNRSAIMVAAVITVLVALTGCSSDSSPGTSSSSASTSIATAPMSTAATGTGSPAGKEQVCAARDQLQESLAALVSPTVIAGGATGITAALEQVRSDLSDVGAAGKDDYASQVTALQSALQEVQSAAGGLGDGNTTSNVGSISASVGAVQTAAQELFTKLAASCD